MGVLLDSSISIAAERRRISSLALMREIRERVGDQDVGLSAIGYTEILHGLYRAQTESHRVRRAEFLEALTNDLPIYPYDRKAAELAARLGAGAVRAGLSIPQMDLFIGATAVSIGFSLLTYNERHFRLIPGLNVMTL